MGHDSSHAAYVNDPNMNVSVAPTFGVNWMTNLLSVDVGGPVIAFNPTVNQTLVYAGSNAGSLEAYSEPTGQSVWSTSVGSGDSIYSTPMVSSDESSVWFGTTANAQMWKLNAATGAPQCSSKTQLAIQMSPTEGLSSSGNPLVYFSSIDAGNIGGPETAINESDCSTVFSVNPYKVPATGSWASPAYGVDANGRRLVIQGTADPDSAEYAMDATTGALDWYFSTGLVGDYDIGAAATVSAPGNNGFADGVLYFIDKHQIAYGIDLTKGPASGQPIWENNFGPTSGVPNGNARSAAALDGNMLVFGMGNGVYALNATTGATLWHYIDPAAAEVISNPAVIGPPGQEVVAFGDMAGVFHVISLATGTSLYSYQTGGYITSSPAYVNGHFLIASTDGFLYDFAAGGGNGTLPHTAVSSPAKGAMLPYTSSVTISGTATDAVGVNAVEVAVQSGGVSGPWYNATTKSWGNGSVTNLVAVANPGATSSAWSFSVPIPLSGATLAVTANAVNVTHQADIAGSKTSFSVSYAPGAPHIQASAVFVVPGTKFAITGSGFKPGETVTFTVGTTALGHATALKTGAVKLSATAPTTNVFGLASITAKGGTSGDTAIAAVDFANMWSQAGGNAAHTGFELNDGIFNATIAPGNNKYLAQAWYFSAENNPNGPAYPVESSPSVYQDQVYFGNDNGTLFAVQNDTSAPAWELTLADNAPIRSTPAIDPATGDLVFTAQDGDVYVVSAATGASIGSTSIGGLPTSATVSNGIAYVGSDDSHVTALNEQSGAQIWRDTLGGPVHATPSLDAAANIIVTGDDSGAISAYNSANGAPLWQVVTKGPVTGSPALATPAGSMATVFAGSSDGNVYAINEATGAALWTRTIGSPGSPITTSPIYDPVLKNVYVGAANGMLYALDPANGTILWTTLPQRSPLSPYVGISGAKSLVFADISSGSLIAFRSSQAGKFNSNHPTSSTLVTAPAVNDGTVYVGANDGGVYAYTTSGSAPLSISKTTRRAAVAIAAQQRHPTWHGVQRPQRSFSWTGQRDVALRVDSINVTSAAGSRMLSYHGGPVQKAARTYVILWNPPGTTVENQYLPKVLASMSTANAGSGGVLAGSYVDTVAMPAALSDGAIQAEIARIVAVNHWNAGLAARFIVLVANGAMPYGSGFCSYHSAVALGHNPAAVAVYGVVPYSGAVGACRTSANLAPSGNSAVDAASVNVRRLQREMANDPLLNGWFDPSGGEVGPVF